MNFSYHFSSLSSGTSFMGFFTSDSLPASQQWKFRWNSLLTLLIFSAISTVDTSEMNQSAFSFGEKLLLLHQQKIWFFHHCRAHLILGSGEFVRDLLFSIYFYCCCMQFPREFGISTLENLDLITKTGRKKRGLSTQSKSCDIQSWKCRREEK